MKLDKNFLVVGCGGLGCNIVENLLRLNVKGIAVCDGDTFESSNLNRQLYALPKYLGANKAVIARMRATELKYTGKFFAVDEYFTKENAGFLLHEVDIVIDALDSIEARLLLEDECEKKGIPIVHGAVNEWVYQVGVSMPGSRLLHSIYQGKSEEDARGSNVNYSFTVAACAAKEVAEAAVLALGEKSELENKILCVDIRD